MVLQGLIDIESYQKVLVLTSKHIHTMLAPVSCVQVVQLVYQNQRKIQVILHSRDSIIICLIRIRHQFCMAWFRFFWLTSSISSNAHCSELNFFTSTSSVMAGCLSLILRKASSQLHWVFCMYHMLFLCSTLSLDSGIARLVWFQGFATNGVLLFLQK